MFEAVIYENGFAVKSYLDDSYLLDHSGEIYVTDNVESARNVARLVNLGL